MYLGHTPIVDFLIQNGAEIDSVDSIGQTPLLVGCEYGKFGFKINFSLFSDENLIFFENFCYASTGP